MKVIHDNEHAYNYGNLSLEEKELIICYEYYVKVINLFLLAADSLLLGNLLLVDG